MGAQSCPSASNCRAVAARCSSPSRRRPPSASASSSSSCARRSNGASRSHCSRQAMASSDARGSASARCSRMAACPARKRRRCVISQALYAALRGMSRPSTKSPPNMRRQRAQALGRERGDAALQRAAHLQRIDAAVGEVEPDRIALRQHARAAGLVEHAAQLAQAPAQLAARVVRQVPQQLAQVAARHLARGERQVGDQRAHLARRRQLDLCAVAADDERTQQLQAQAGACRRSVDSTRDSTPATTLLPTTRADSALRRPRRVPRGSRPPPPATDRSGVSAIQPTEQPS